MIVEALEFFVFWRSGSVPSKPPIIHILLPNWSGLSLMLIKFPIISVPEILYLNSESVLFLTISLSSNVSGVFAASHQLLIVILKSL